MSHKISGNVLEILKIINNTFFKTLLAIDPMLCASNTKRLSKISKFTIIISKYISYGREKAFPYGHECKVNIIMEVSCGKIRHLRIELLGTISVPGFDCSGQRNEYRIIL